MPELSAENITILETDIKTCVRVSLLIPEFDGPPDASEYHRRLQGVPHLLLGAFYGDQAVGFKAGYQREDYFYSWMGGVLPEYRQLGLAQELARRQEAWAKAAGYDSITFKTRNQHKAMLIFALKNGFNIIGFREKESIATNRILLRKTL